MSVNRSVDVIAVFNNLGKIRPIYVKIEGFDVIKIDQVVKVKTEKESASPRIEFQCSYIYQNEKRMIILYFWLNKHIWAIPDLNTNDIM